jgi:hypothetical protein
MLNGPQVGRRGLLYSRGYTVLWYGLALAWIVQYRPRDAVSTPVPASPSRQPPVLCRTSRLPALPLLRSPPQIAIGSFAAKSTCPSYPKTNGLGSSIAPVASADIKSARDRRSTGHPPPTAPSPSPLAVWTPPRLGKDAAGYSFPQDIRTLLLSPFNLDVSLHLV